jgi:hypothetical protein
MYWENHGDKEEPDYTDMVQNNPNTSQSSVIMSKIKIEIKNRFTGKMLFELETENNTQKKTLEEAVNTGAYLRGAYLRGAYLRGANLRGAYLRGAYLRGADLRGADLRGADLTDADLTGADLAGADLAGAGLTGADLRGADLRGADLRGAYLRGANLRGEKIKSAAVFTGLYKYVVIPYITEANEYRIKMGCYDRLLNEWETDFWNNPSEFPNDGSMKSNLRLRAFNTAKTWLELQPTDTTIDHSHIFNPEIVD